jgi:hypothetical protein
MMPDAKKSSNHAEFRGLEDFFFCPRPLRRGNPLSFGKRKCAPPCSVGKY